MIKDIAYNILGDNYSKMAVHWNQFKTLTYSHIHPFKYDKERYESTFLMNNSQIKTISTNPVDRVIYIFWTGHNEITPNRMKGIKSLENVAQVEVKLISPDNLKDYLVDEDPLPEAYQYLSYVHKSDYLRSYFMFHHGGGYADIKTFDHSWLSAFDLLDDSKDAQMVGYPEVGFWGVANHGIVNGNLRKDLYYYWRYLIGNCAFIFRPHSAIADEWHTEAKRRLEALTPILRNHPATDPFGTNSDYPVVWASLMGELLHPLCLKYHETILKDKNLLPCFQENWR